MSEDPSDSGEDIDDELLREVARIEDVDPESAPLAAGARLAHFEIKRELGRGGMGVVYLAEDLDLKREVALKLLPARRARDPERRRRLLREARAVAALADPRVVVVHEVGEAGGRVFLAMERLDGESLRARLDRGLVPIAEAIAIAGELVRGLAAVHAAGLVHRDLKPENVMLVGAGLKLLDFGLAKHGERDGAAEALAETTLATEEGRVLGTPAYLAPEQAVGGEADARSDLFAAGVVLYELFTGRRPFAAGTTSELVAAILTRAPEPPASVRAEIGEPLSRVVLRCLEKKPSDRYPSAAALLADLERASAAATGRRRLGPIAIVIAVLVGVAFIAAPLWRPSVATGPAATASALATTTAPAETPEKMTDSPPPTSSSPAALAAYRRALEKFRGADFEAAMAALEKSAELDPNLGAAYLRRAMFKDQGAQGAELYAKASTLRASLGDRDRALLDAWEPQLARHPPNTKLAGERMGALAAARPNDAEAQLLAAFLDVWNGEREAAKAHADRALAIDPGFAIASAFLAEWHYQAQDYDAALATARACWTKTPSALNCRRDELDVYYQTGRCGELAAGARDALALRSSATELRDSLANALAHEGAAPEALFTALRGGAPISDWQGQYEPSNRLWIASLSGDFDAALATAREIEKAADGDPSRYRHDAALADHLALALEADRVGEAADVAEAYLKVREAYVDDRGNWSSMALGDALADLALFKAKRIDRAELDRRADALAEVWDKRTPELYRPGVWSFTLGLDVIDRADAERALARHRPYARGAFVPELYLAETGRALVLAGRADEAIAPLEEMTKRCGAGRDFLQALYWLGRAREANGDAPGACVAYGKVLDRWGQAKPRSVTANEARRRLAPLHCPPRSP